MPDIRARNIFTKLTSSGKKEKFKTLSKAKGFRVERIVSTGQSTQKGAWLSEKTAEWVMVLEGRASLIFKNRKTKFTLKRGDYILIPANTLHRVEWTHPKQKTVWLAVHGDKR